MKRPRVPASTYRLQLGEQLGFKEVAALVGYLDALGVGAVYLSPPLQARSSSTHGYDITDPRKVDARHGGRRGIRALGSKLKRAGMGLVIDVVPNHMAASHENPWWWDVLARGRRSPHAEVFDIDFDDPLHAGRVLVPVLGDHYADVLSRGELQAADGELRYYDNRFPLRGDAEPLEQALERQAYRLVFWRRANEEVNYRRFFDITDLVCVRVEDRGVLERTHRLIAQLVQSDVVTGLRIDHVDGLLDPQGYLEGLRELCGGVYLVVEKILGPGEDLREDWPVDGTTGYEVANAINDVFVDPGGLNALTGLWRKLTGCDEDFDDLTVRLRRRVLDELFAADLRRLVSRLHVTARDDPEGRDVALRDLTEALVELTVRMPVYRSYMREGGVDAEDRAVIERAAGDAAGSADERALGVVARVLAGSETGERWQQLTGPVMAKGFEDTALYVYTPLISRDEVGGDPGRPPPGVEGLHALHASRSRRWPAAMSSTSTHDSKRGEDVRARVNVLTEIPARWERDVRRWLRRGPHGLDVATRMLAFQTLVGIWPLDEPDLTEIAERMREYMVKAVREAKTHTSWIDADETYESQVTSFVDTLLRDSRFRRELTALVEEIALPAAVNALGQVVLKVASPGVPDFYQGTELWHLVLVDPDNRRPVDFDARRAILASLDDCDLDDVVVSWRDGRVKMLVTARSLRARRDAAELFVRGDYLPLDATGARRGNVLAFARRRARRWAVAVVPRLVASMCEDGRMPLGRRVWGRASVALPPGAPQVWRNALTGAPVHADGGRLQVADVLSRLPVALLAGPARPQP